MEPTRLPRKLHWVNEAFSRELIIKNGETPVGSLVRNWFSSDVDAQLNGLRVRFDVRGFLKRSVTIFDAATEATLGTLSFGWGQRSATLQLTSGETYTWQRKDWLTREWSLVHDLAGTDAEAVHYTRLRDFFSTAGELELLESSPQAEILVLTGLFVYLYFRQQAATTAAIAASA